MKTIAVFGATGRTGRPFTELALQNGYQVRALVRDPLKLGLDHSNLLVLQGDIVDPKAVEETIRGADAVALLVGFSPSLKSPAGLRSTAAQNVVSAMRVLGVQRLIRLTSFVGAKDPRDKLGLPMKLMLRMFDKAIVADETEAAGIVMGSGTDWTIVRNAMITRGGTDGAKAGHVGQGKSSVSASDLAAFILGALSSGEFTRKMPFIGS